MAETDRGPGAGGATQGDSFKKRESASEDLYVRQQEQEKLRILKQKIQDSEKQLAKDKEDAAKMEK